jgi:hypothetical protein
MAINKAISSKYFSKSIIGGTVSINDLKEKELNGELLDSVEKAAICNYDKFRLIELSKEVSESDFHSKYIQLQVMANLSPFEEFLKEQYCTLP